MREGVTEKLTDHVWAIPDGCASLVPNVGIVVGKKAVLVVDTGMGTRNAETVLREVAKVGRAASPSTSSPRTCTPNTTWARMPFPKDSKLIRSKTQVEDIAAGAGMNLVPLFASRSELNKELLKDAKHRDADIVFDAGLHTGSRRRHGEDPSPWAPITRTATPWYWSTACCSRATWP